VIQISSDHTDVSDGSHSRPTGRKCQRHRHSGLQSVSTRLNAAGQIIRDRFPNNQIPANLINAGTVAYAQAVLPPAQNVGVTRRNAVDTTPLAQDMGSYTARVDQTIGEKNFFWFRHSRVDQDTTQSAGLPNLRQIVARPGYNYGASYGRTFSPTFTIRAPAHGANPALLSPQRGQRSLIRQAVEHCRSLQCCAHSGTWPHRTAPALPEYYFHLFRNEFRQQ
jgi:hypothetical protein